MQLSHLTEYFRSGSINDISRFCTEMGRQSQVCLNTYVLELHFTPLKAQLKKPAKVLSFSIQKLYLKIFYRSNVTRILSSLPE